MQNIIINNIYIFIFITFVNLKILIDIFTINFLSKFNSFVTIFSNILYCYLNNIFYSKLNIKNIIKIFVNFFFIIVINIINSFYIKSFLNLF